jgi:hypothetical protein
LSWPLPEALSDEALERLVYPPPVTAKEEDHAEVLARATNGSGVGAIRGSPMAKPAAAAYRHWKNMRNGFRPDCCTTLFDAG